MTLKSRCDPQKVFEDIAPALCFGDRATFDQSFNPARRWRSHFPPSIGEFEDILVSGTKFDLYLYDLVAVAPGRPLN
jgi:hypothetical protein